MDLTNIPTLVAVPFASGAGTDYINPIPVASQIPTTPGAASYTDGFVPVNFQPIASGGVPPFGKDMNGILNALSVANRWNQAGGKYAYNATFATDIGGYPKGALLERSTQDGFWLSTANNNTTNPDTGGAGWVDPLAGRLLNVQVFTASGTYTPTPGTKSVIVELAGAGGAGGGTAACSASQCAAAPGGSAGGYTKSRITAGFSGVTVTVGAGGTGATGASGGNGGASAFGSLLSTPGGNGGGATAAQTSFPFITGYTNGGGVGVGGNILNATGGFGTTAFMTTGSTAISGSGGASFFGAGANASINATANGNAATTPGGGGSGATTIAGGAARAGGNGAPGICIVYEYA